MDHNIEIDSLNNATNGFNRLFENDIHTAKQLFTSRDDPFHQLGLGVCAFLEAALGMEATVIDEANRTLTLAEAGTRKFTKSKEPVENHRFHPGVEWEILNADAVVLLGLIHALSESYMGYIQCLYALNSAHSKFTKLYKTVFPNGIDSYLPSQPQASGAVSREPSFTGSVSYSSTSSAATSTSTLPQTEKYPNPIAPNKRSLFSRLTPTASTPALTAAHHRPHLHPSKLDGPIDDLIIAGTAFGYGLFNLVFSLLPKRIQSVVGFFGFKSDRKLALKALDISAARNDTHSVFAALVLMTYYGVILLLSGYQANESRIINEYQKLVDRTFDKFPNGALWILNKAKILRMSHEPETAINVLQDGLKPNRPYGFTQADSLLVFELAWTLLGQRRYEEAATTFLRITELNTWSHATYYFIAAGCYWSLGNFKKAQQLFDAIPGSIDKKIGGKDLPTEVYLKKKIAFYKAKQKRLGKDETRFVEAITLSPSEEIAIFWNTHARISETVALLHIQDWCSTCPAPKISSPHNSPPKPSTPTATTTPTTTITPSSTSTSTLVPTTTTEEPLLLDTPDEFALRSLLLGVVHRTMKSYDTSRAYLLDAHDHQNRIEISTWIGGVAMFELAVLDLKEAATAAAATSTATDSTTIAPAVDRTCSSDNQDDEEEKKQKQKRKRKALEIWKKAIKSASGYLDKAMALATNSTDLSSRLDLRISLLRDEIAIKREELGV